MKELGRHISDETQIIFGTAVDSRMGNRLSVMLISSLAGEGTAAAPPKEFMPHVLPQPELTSKPAVAPPIYAEPEEVLAPTADEAPSASEPAASFVKAFARKAPVEPLPAAEPPELEAEEEQLRMEEPARPVSAAPAPVARKKVANPGEDKISARKIAPAKQEVLQFEPVTRGRFEKSEPTIVEGQDLDIPTFLRKNVRVK
jgi:cell division protein FtsZ